MKIVYFLLSFFFFCVLYQEASAHNFSITKTVVKSGSWSAPDVWEGNQIPKSGDKIIIPSEFVVEVNDKIDYTAETQNPNAIYIHGTLVFNGRGELQLPTGSIVKVEDKGIIKNESSQLSCARIRIGKAIYFTGNDEIIKGPYVIQKSADPSSFINFNVSLQHKKALIQWAISSEIVNSSFELQRNIDLDKWETVAVIPSQQNNGQVHHYEFVDKDRNSFFANYRLKIIDNGGAYALSPVRSAKYTEAGPDVSIGRCTEGNIVLHFSQQISSSLEFKLENLAGDLIHKKKIKDPKGDIDIKLNDVAPGNYMATVTGPGGFKFMQPVHLN